MRESKVLKAESKEDDDVTYCSRVKIGLRVIC